MADKDAQQHLELSTRVVALEHLLKLLLWNFVLSKHEDKKDVILTTLEFRSDCFEALQSASTPPLPTDPSGAFSKKVIEQVDRIFQELVEEMEEEYGIRRD